MEKNTETHEKALAIITKRVVKFDNRLRCLEKKIGKLSRMYDKKISVLNEKIDNVCSTKLDEIAKVAIDEIQKMKDHYEEKTKRKRSVLDQIKAVYKKVRYTDENSQEC